MAGARGPRKEGTGAFGCRRRAQRPRGPGVLMVEVMDVVWFLVPVIGLAAALIDYTDTDRWCIGVTALVLGFLGPHPLDAIYLCVGAAVLVLVVVPASRKRATRPIT